MWLFLCGRLKLFVSLEAVLKLKYRPIERNGNFSFLAFTKGGKPTENINPWSYDGCSFLRQQKWHVSGSSSAVICLLCWSSLVIYNSAPITEPPSSVRLPGRDVGKEEKDHNFSGSFWKILQRLSCNKTLFWITRPRKMDWYCFKDS